MIELIKTYSISEIIIFIVLLGYGIKEIIILVDWFKDLAKNGFNRELQRQRKNDSLESRLDEMDKVFVKKEQRFQKKKEEINDSLTSLQGQINNIASKVDLLVNSDRDDIKSYITEKYHYFCYEKKWIDDYSLDCLEKRYSHYTAEGGNSYILYLMNEIRKLPKEPPKK